MEQKNKTIPSLEEEALEQASGGNIYPSLPHCACTRCRWMDILPPKDWKCPICGSSVITKVTP